MKRAVFCLTLFLAVFAGFTLTHPVAFGRPAAAAGNIEILTPVDHTFVDEAKSLAVVVKASGDTFDTLM